MAKYMREYWLARRFRATNPAYSIPEMPARIKLAQPHQKLDEMSTQDVQFFVYLRDRTKMMLILQELERDMLDEAFRKMFEELAERTEFDQNTAKLFIE